MWKERLEEIRQEETKYGAGINGGVSADEAQVFVKAEIIS